MPDHYVPRSTTLSDVLATHRRQIDHLMRENQSLWTVIRLIEGQQAKEREHRRACDAQARAVAPPEFEYEGDLFGGLA